MIYCDNGATSWPKPPQMLEQMTHFVNDIGGSPGRSGHTASVEAERIAFGVRESLAEMFNIKDPQQIAFTKNITESLNYVIQTQLKPGDHVITSSMEHNSVMRPLRMLEDKGLELTVVQCDSEGFLDAAKVKEAIKPNTKMIVVNHASNVVGTIQDVEAVGKVAHEAGVLFTVDAAQSAGLIPIDVEKMHIDFLCVTGHKGLLGPTGTGAVYANPAIKVTPLMLGGTGSNSEFEKQPEVMPDVWESGTMNIIGVAGLSGSLAFLKEVGVANVHKREVMLTQRFIDGIKDVPCVILYGPHDASKKTAVTSINIEGAVCSEVGKVLDQAFGIMTRTGLHCSPAAHKTIGSFPQGTVRFGFSYFTTEEEVDEVIEAVKQIAAAAAE